MRVLIYGRVSRDPRGENRSVKEQVQECTTWAEAEGWEIVRVVRETGSASRYATANRDRWAEVMEAIGARRVDALLTWESSRATRDLTAYAELRDACALASVKWGYSGRLHDLSERDSRFRTGLDALLAEDEAARTSERLQRMTRHNAKAGRPHGKNLYGYERIYNQASRTLIKIIPKKGEAENVQEAARRVLAGETHYQIAKSFNAREIPPRRASYQEHRKKLGWTAVAIRQMLEQPAYAGLRQHKGEVVGEAIWPPLITRPDWERLQAIFNDPSRRTVRDWTAVHLLSGIAVCGVCGTRVRMGKQNYGRPAAQPDGHPIRKTYPTYLCPGSPGMSSFHVTIKAQFLDDLVTEAVLQRLERPDVVDLLKTSDPLAESERARLREEIESNRAYLEQVRQRAASERDLDLLFDQEARINPLINAAQRELEQLLDADPAVLRLVQHGDIRHQWAGLELGDKRRVLRALVEPRVLRALARGTRSHDQVMKRVELRWL